MTNAAPPFELTPYAGKVWRFVEDQNTSSTMKLVDTMDEHAILEELLDASKPPVPVACQHLHYLQFTPFRYPARHATRFRRKGDRRGVYYAAETIQTAATEVAFYRMLFFVESPETDPPKAPFAMSVFSTEIDTPRALDMVAACDADLRADCADPVDYATCHLLSEAVREAQGQVIRYPSVRDPEGMNVAVLRCAAFASAGVADVQNWWFRFGAQGIFAAQGFGPGRMAFLFESFAGDPRVTGWEV